MTRPARSAASAGRACDASCRINPCQVPGDAAKSLGSPLCRRFEGTLEAFRIVRIGERELHG
jgi:hypothetical protein